MTSHISRRTALKGLSGVAATTAAALSSRLGAADESVDADLKGNINHSVCRWCYKKVSLEDLCKAGKAMGLKSIELMKPEDWPTLAKYGLTCAIGSGGGLGIARGFNRVELHDELVASYEELVPKAAAADIPSVICFSGNRDGMPDDEGLANCVKGVKRLVKLCEEHQVNLVMELLNSKVNHPDYMCDHTAWGAELCRQVGSERFGLLYDIYHMQIMEGDVIRTIRDNAEFIKHYHTGGVPGRNEIDQTQELYYPAIMRAIVETGYEGYVGQEFIPTWDDQLAALKQGVTICDV